MCFQPRRGLKFVIECPDFAYHHAAPALTMLAGTAIGAAPYDAFFGQPPPTDYFRAHPRIEDHFHAVIYLGPEPIMAPLGYPRCADPDYVAMRVARVIFAGIAADVKERLANDCDAARG